MLKKENVMIFPAGSEIGIEIYNSLKYSHHINVFGVSGKSDHASFLYDKNNYVEDSDLYIDNPDFIASINKTIDLLGIDYIYPTHDSISLFLSENKKAISATIITSSERTNYIARFKKETYELINDFDFCPIQIDTKNDGISFPVFVKPNDGQGGKGAFIVETKDELKYHLDKNPDLLVVEYLPGKEISVDCFTDYKGRLLFIGPRTRERVQMGISFRTSTMPVDEEINNIANTLNDLLDFNGAWFFQLKKDINGKYKLLEFAARQASTMGLYRHAGINFALLSYFNAQQKDVEILKNDFSITLDRCLLNRFKSKELFFSRVYIDLDETIIVDGHVHNAVMSFLYQCRNMGKEIVLISKHRYDIFETLKKCAISPLIFSEIIHIDEFDNKWKYIKKEGSIFIDNCWHERKEVNEKTGIFVFDVDAIESLTV